MTSIDLFARQGITTLLKKNQLRKITTSYESATTIHKDNCKLISFAGNDYFGLANDERLKIAAINAIKQYGTGAAASRIVTGNNQLYETLEKNIAALKQTQQAVIFGSGYLAAIGVIPAIIGKNDIVIADKLIHSSLLDGIKLSGATLKRFLHNDYQSCEKLLKTLRQKYDKCLLVTETIFSMDGDQGDIKQLSELSEKYNCWLLSDDAHGLGIVNNPTTNYSHDNHIQIGTLSKACGAYGGYAAASKNICDFLITKAKSLIYTTALPPAVIASANQAIEIIAKEKNLGKKLLQKTQILCSELNLEKPQSSIVKIEFKTIDKMYQMADKLEKEGFYVARIRPPTAATPRIRITISLAHSDADILRLAQALQ